MDPVLESELNFDLFGTRDNVITDPIESLFDCAEPLEDTGKDTTPLDGHWIIEGNKEVWKPRKGKFVGDSDGFKVLVGDK